MLYHVVVNKSVRDLYQPDFLHDNIGYIWQQDEEHVWFKFVIKDINGTAYISGPHRFVRFDVDVSIVEMV
jgi:hypothetical protein